MGKIFNSRICFVLQSLKLYNEAFSDFRDGKDDAKEKYDLALEKLCSALQNTSFIQDVLESEEEAKGVFDELQKKELFQKKEDLDFELSVAHNFGFSKNQAWNIILPSMQKGIMFKSIESANKVTQSLRDNHLKTINEIEASRALSRKPKKTRKRNISQAFTSFILGIGSLVGNAYFPPTKPYSYAFAFYAFHQASRDIVGERRDD